MTKIDVKDCDLVLRVSDRCRISVYNHMRAFLLTEIQNRGFSVNDPKLFNMLTIETQAMDLANRLIRDVEAEATDSICLAQVEYAFEMKDAPEIVRELIEDNALADIKKEYLDDDMLGLDALIQMATGTPLAVGGSDMELNFGLGPDNDDETE